MKVLCHCIYICLLHLAIVIELYAYDIYNLDKSRGRTAVRKFMERIKLLVERRTHHATKKNSWLDGCNNVVTDCEKKDASTE